MEVVSAYKMEKERLKKTLIRKEVARKVMKLPVMHSKRIVYLLGTETSLLVKKNEELVSRSSPTTTSASRFRN